MLSEYELNGGTYLLSEEEAKQRGATLLNKEQDEPAKKQRTTVKNKAVQSPQEK